MNIQEDYKRKYEQAIENLKRIKTANKDNKELVEFIEYEYPELKESEDERIRKHLIKHFGNKSKEDWNGVPVKSILAWLEKQGEQKFPSLSEKEIVCLKRILDFLREEHNSYTGKDFTNEIAVLEWLITHPVLIHFSELQQTQGWQKPVVITPKFHKGDIIKPKGSSHTHWEIMQVDMFDKKYRFKNGCVIHFSQEDDYELVEQKPAWSEEDEEMYNFVLNELKENEKCKPCYSVHFANLIGWFKSIKERYAWKPSDKQMKQLGWVAEQNKDNMIGKELMSLYQDLKKLREE